ncbi:MAG TPA: ATP-binding protein, partial [Ktedonobacteraceae bacterium]|nr:ATP-binding protein [Ktedonobacteraceae bacterium]
MIILKHLTVERFRLLREINLHFPQRGSILIQGPNEAGKSALFESIYFALYGTPLTATRDNR